jgi:transposase
MPRQSPFSIDLSSEERQALESMARKYTSPYCDVIRAKIILLADEGLSNDVIAARLDTPRQIVSKWRKRFALARLPGLEAQPRGGRKARFSPPASSFRLRPWPASFLTASGFRCPGSLLRRSANT